MAKITNKALLPSFARFILLFAILLLISCGGGSSPSDQTQPSNKETTTTVTIQNNATGLGAIPTSAQTLSYIPIIPTPTGNFGHELPSSIDLSSKMPPVRNQGKQNSCVGWAVGYYLKSYQEHLDQQSKYGVDANHSGAYSPAFIYNITKDGNSCEAGSSIASALSILSDIGIASWEAMPYNQNSCDSLPSPDAINEARCAKVSQFQRFNLSSPIKPHTLEEMKYQLFLNNPIVIALYPYQDFIKPKQYNGEYYFKEYNANESVAMAHAVVVVGYDENKNAFKIVNSWGKTWGNEGYLWIDYNIFAKIVFEAYIAKDEKSLCHIQTTNEIPTLKVMEDTTTEVNAPLPIQAVAYDVDGKIDKIEWQENGEVIARSAYFNYTPTTLGEHILVITITDDKGATISDSVSITAIDSTPPQITLKGANSITIERSSNYQDQGVEIEDNFDTNAKLTTTGSVDTNRVGEYTITYQAIDSNGNQSTQTRTVIVKEVVDITITDNIDGKAGVTLINRNWVKDIVTFNIEFSEAVEGFDSEDIIVTNGTKSNFRGSGKSYHIDVTPLTNSKATITLSIDNTNATGISGNTLKTTKATQEVDTQKAFITVWDTRIAGETKFNQIKIIKYDDSYGYPYSYNCTIDWGDGKVDYNVVDDITHTYDEAGIYTIQIKGIFPSFYLQTMAFSYYDRNKLLSVKQWGTQEWKTMVGAFTECSNFNLEAIDNPNLSHVTSMSSMFFKASKFNADINSWDVSNVIYMSSMFGYAEAFNSSISNWDVSNVTSMRNMFLSATSFNQPLNNWDVANVIDMAGMFWKAISFNQPLNDWDVSNVVYMGSNYSNGMFQDASSFNQNLSSWDTSKVENMNYLFYGAKSFNQDLSSWIFSSVKQMKDMFKGTKLSSYNYGRLLQSLSQSDLYTGIELNVGSTQYSPNYADERQYIIDTFGWTISDGGVTDE
jgi:surface protein